MAVGLNLRGPVLAIYTTVLILTWRWTMFDNLDDQIRKDTQASSSNTERAMVWLAVAVITILAFGAVYYGIHNLS